MQHRTASDRPRIGVTSADDPTPDNYVAAIERCGGTPIVLKSVVANVDADLSAIDGLLVTGGADIDPARYGAAPHATTETGDPDRDAYELAMIVRAFDRKMPTLAICRGMQIANVAWGGDLLQHIPDVVGDAVVHRDMERKFEPFAEHTVDVDPASRLAALTRSVRFATNASHHQAVGRPGSGLVVVARTPDGIVEALERSDAESFWLATQWHPERLLDTDGGRSRAIFDAFLEAAARTAALDAA